jgi:nucleoside diphosphate kinase
MDEYTYALITPYSLFKSRTGGITGRILSHSFLDLCAAKMYSPSNKMVDEYIDALQSESLSLHNKRLFTDYINQNLRPNNLSPYSNRCLLFIFKGKNAISIMRRTVGHITYKPKGDTVRATFGDYIEHGNKMSYFEPAVLTSSDRETTKRQLKIFKKYAESDGGVITHALDAYVKKSEKNQITLVMLKPDTFGKKSSRPGNIIDIFSKTGLFIVGAKLVHFSINQAKEFYQPLKKILEAKLIHSVKEKIKELLIPHLPYYISNEEIDAIASILRKKNATYEFNRIIEYITGLKPDMIPESNHNKPGKEKCLVLLYYGRNAILKIRQKLGATNPQVARDGTVRREYGENIMKNGTHGSDSPENAFRERRIVGLVGNESSELDDILLD